MGRVLRDGQIDRGWEIDGISMSVESGENKVDRWKVRRQWGRGMDAWGYETKMIKRKRKVNEWRDRKGIKD